jgi:hypothetical protein
MTRALHPTRARIPLATKVAFSAFMAVLVPFYWSTYGPTNFLYFCDVALFLTLAGVWLESALLVSIPAVGIVVPQLLWVADFAAGLVYRSYRRWRSQAAFERELELGWVLLVEDPEAGRRQELLPFGAMPWTSNGVPAAWRRRHDPW